MRTQRRGWITVAAAAVSMVAVVGAAGCQTPTPTAEENGTSQVPRTASGRPDFNGIWQTFNTANWNIQDHAASQGPLISLGAAFSVPGGQGVVVGNEIPYQAWALEKKDENAENWLTRDPEIKCYMPGVPRAMYMPYPFQIIQTPSHVLIAYEFADASRTIYVDSDLESPFDTWMGHSTGRWDGDTLVVDVTSFNDQTWFDRAGNFHSAALHVVERSKAKRRHPTRTYRRGRRGVTRISRASGTRRPGHLWNGVTRMPGGSSLPRKSRSSEKRGALLDLTTPTEDRGIRRAITAQSGVKGQKTR